MKKKPILRFAFAAEEANVTHHTQVTQPLLGIAVPFIPTQISLSIVVGISHFDFEEDYSIDIHLTNAENGEVIGAMNWSIREQRRSNGAPPAGLLVGGLKNSIIRNEGSYVIQVYSDSEHIGNGFVDIYSDQR